MTFNRLEEVDDNHWRIVVDGDRQAPRRCFELWCPRDSKPEEVEEFLVQVIEIMRRRRSNEGKLPP